MSAGLLSHRLVFLSDEGNISQFEHAFLGSDLFESLIYMYLDVCGCKHGVECQNDMLNCSDFGILVIRMIMSKIKLY